MSLTGGAGSAPVLLNPSEFPKPLGYNPFPNTLEPYIAAVLFEAFLYGIYSVLFSICLYILIRKRQMIHWILPVLASVMFSIATADISYTLYLLFRSLLKGVLTFQDMRPKYWLFVTNNVLADCTFLYRCYVVWGGDLRIIALPALLLIASVVCGYLFEGSTSVLFAYSWIYVLLTFVFNVILTGLTAGRIWWLSRKGNNILDRSSRKRYDVALAAILESGFLTALYMIPDLILVNIILDNGFVQVVGIVPTLIVVQVGLGRAVKPVEVTRPEPLQIAARTTTQNGAIISFNPDTQTATVESKDDDSSRFMSSGSMLAFQDQLRTGEDRIAIEEKTRDVEGKPPESDVKQAGPEFGPGWDPEKVYESHQKLPLFLPSELDKREEAHKS